MTNDSPNAPAGWYPNPEGGQRYWDGEKWLDIPVPPQSSEEVSEVQSRSTSNNKMFLWIAAGVVAIALIIAASISSNQAAQEQALKEEQAAQVEQERKAKAAAEAAAEAEKKRVLEERTQQVAQIVESVKGSAQELLDTGYISGSIIDAYCNPVAGGSLSDIEESTTAFECFVATKENGDGTQNGYFWDVTKNWDTGRYTWDFREN